jgi:hypothetical protein
MLDPLHPSNNDQIQDRTFTILLPNLRNCSPGVTAPFPAWYQPAAV